MTVIARDEARARDLILAHGWNATAYQLLNPGIEHWFSSRGDALVGYARSAGMRVVAGAPVCASERLDDVVSEFGADSAAAGERVCYFGAGARLEQTLLARGDWSVASLGAQPSWDPAHWPELVAGHRSLRAQLNRARNKQVVVDEWRDPPPADRAELRECLAQWLAGRHLPALHFLVEPDTLGRLSDRRLFVARRAGRVVAFLLASPVPARGGWLVEQIIRGTGAPNGTAELLLDHAMRALAGDGARYVTLGLAPLSRHSRADRSDMPLWLRLTLRFARLHGRRFYDFDGLDRFKAKFHPEEWEEIVALAPGRRFPVRALWAIAGVFGQCSPVTLAGRALARAARQEAGWLVGRVRGRSASAGGQPAGG